MCRYASVGPQTCRPVSPDRGDRWTPCAASLDQCARVPARLLVVPERSPKIFVQQLVFATVTIGVVAYLVKGRDGGLALWLCLIGAAVFSGLALLLREIVESRRD